MNFAKLLREIPLAWGDGYKPNPTVTPALPAHARKPPLGRSQGRGPPEAVGDPAGSAEQRGNREASPGASSPHGVGTTH